MKCSSASTSERGRGALGAGLLSLLLAGCQSAPRPAAYRPVYADLGALVRRNPGWPGVARYDRALALLDRSVRQARSGVSRPLPPLALPAPSGLSLSGEAYTMPAAALAQERRQLAAQQQVQIERLRRRRTQARRQQTALEEGRWRREAQARYALAVQAAQQRYAQRFSDAFTSDSARRLNLRLQIVVLQKTVADWSLSKPPTPQLDRARADLARKQALLDQLASLQTGALADIRRARDAALAQAATDRDAYIAGRQAALVAALTAQDAQVLALQRALLRGQTESLLRQERVMASAAVPTAGPLAGVALAPAAPAAAPLRALAAAEARLRGQRARWVDFLYDETRDAARELGRRQGWQVTFRPGAPDVPDQTRRLGVLLSSQAWRA